MTTPVNLYPLSTVDGKYVPLDVIKPMGLTQVNFNHGQYHTVTITNENSLLVLRASADCYLKFGSSVDQPGDNTYVAGLFYLECGEVMTVAPSSTSLSVIGATNAGTLIVQEIYTWAALNNPNRFNRG